MKQILLFASAIALMTSCAKQDTGTSNAVPNFEGVAFNAVAEGQGETKAEWTAEGEQWLMNWYAEQDKVSVFYKQALLSNTGYATTWSEGTSSTIGAATYKATRTEKGGYFTADAATEILNWDLTKTTDAAKAASFIVTWPAITSNATTNTVTTIPVPANVAQTQSDLNGASTVKNVFMVTAPKALDDVAPVKNGSASDALINMTLTRPFPVAYFKLKNYDKDVFGTFTSITLETKGSTTPVVAASTITFDQATYDATKTPNVALTDAGTPASKITLTMSGLASADWTDANVAYMAISNVDRTAFVTAPETVEVVYNFQYGSVKDEFTTKANWFGSAAGGRGFINMSNAGTAIDGAFDLMAAPYLVLNRHATLIINETCNLSIAAIVAKENLTPGNITKLTVKKELNSTDLNYLKGFTGLTDVTLMKNTKLAKGTFASALVKLNAPMVTEIEKDFSTGTVALTDVILPSYPFGTNVDADNQLLKAASLVTLDASSCNSFAPVFPSIGISLQGFAKLTTIVVKNGVSVGANAFKGCILLTDVNFPKGVTGGAIKLVGNNAFDGCAVLTSISVDLVASNNTIPQGAFNACALLEIISHDGVTGFAPVKVGASAFDGCAKLETIDLSNATTVGANAFKGCTVLNGSNKIEGKDVMVVAVAKLEAGVFENCAGLKYLQFPNATEVVAGAMGSTGNATTTLTQIEFLKAFTITAASPDVLTFGTITTTDLFVKGDQTGVLANNTDIELGKTTTTKFTFKSINANN